MDETEKVKFKTLNRLTRFRLIVSPSNCWLVEGANIRKYHYISFHGIAYRLHVISAILFLNHDVKKQVLHKCDIEGCCNPSHLYSGNDLENARDRRYRRNNNIPKGEVINRPPVQPIEEFSLEFLPPDKPVN